MASGNRKYSTRSSVRGPNNVIYYRNFGSEARMQNEPDPPVFQMKSNLPRFSATEQSPAFDIWNIKEQKVLSIDLKFEAFKTTELK